MIHDPHWLNEARPLWHNYYGTYLHSLPTNCQALGESNGDVVSRVQVCLEGESWLTENTFTTQDELTLQLVGSEWDTFAPI